MVLLNTVHPLAGSTSLGFALHTMNEKKIVLFGLAVDITAALAVIHG